MEKACPFGRLQCLSFFPRDLCLQVSPPKVGGTDSLQMMVSNLDYDQHKGRMAIGRVNSGRLQKGQSVAVAKPGK